MDRDLSLTYKEAVGWDFRDRVGTVETIADAPIRFRAEMIIVVNCCRRRYFAMMRLFVVVAANRKHTAKNSIPCRVRG